MGSGCGADSGAGVRERVPSGAGSEAGSGVVALEQVPERAPELLLERFWNPFRKKFR